MRCVLIACISLAIITCAQGEPQVRRALRRITPRSSRLDGLVERLKPPDVQAVTRRPNPMSVKVIREELLLGAQTMLRYHHVLMAASFFSRYLFKLFVTLSPKKQLRNAALGLNSVAGTSMKINVFHKMATWSRFVLYVISQALQGRLNSRTFDKLFADFCELRGYVQANVIYPMMEELTFRGGAQGLTQTILSNFDMSVPMLPQLVGAVFFSIAHSAHVNNDVYFALIAQRVAGSFLTSLLLLGRLADRRRCVWTSVGAHVFWNVFAEWPTSGALINIGIESLLSPLKQFPRNLLRFGSYFFLHVISLNFVRAFFGVELIESVTPRVLRRRLASLFRRTK